MRTDICIEDEPRNLKSAILNGLRLKCPKCGNGKLLYSYLKVKDTCDSCRQPLHCQRADDGPAYLTILVVGHIMGFALHIAWVNWRPEPWVLAVTMSTIAIVGSLILLPRMKGLIVAYQWAKRLHGF
ncbi:DUF983 domain-containing protein [Roseovarius sp. 10]|uniref:DUF983 domain-containing protein n=1 Tax=Roseovarius sp. 10 TaxID=3080563 RepID=UPI0029546994|nr:DUF983 domain-containing protein [Roseovarius sp. 10]MDV7200143.1 DUF983 domain-containing protein [Roseovarius sp. 10]